MTDFDILKPELVWVQGRCYRKLPIRKVNLNPEETEYDIYPSHQYARQEEDDSLRDIDIKHSVNEFWVTINVPAPLFGAVVGAKRQTVRRIENETKTRVQVPKPSESHLGEITVYGEEKWGVAAAYRKIERIVSSARGRQDFTHFVSFPMNFDNLKNSFLEFKDDVLQHRGRIRGLDERIFQKPERLHLTVVTLTLLDEHEREKAAAVLQKFKEDVRVHLDSKPLTVSVRGIEYMNDDPSEVDVLYAKVQDCDSEEKLQVIADALLQKFEATDLGRKQHDRVKLHFTLINTVFRSGSEDMPRPVRGTRRRETFDARYLIENYGDYDFGTVTLSEIHISVRYSAAKDRYYSSSSVLKLP